MEHINLVAYHDQSFDQNKLQFFANLVKSLSRRFISFKDKSRIPNISINDYNKPEMRNKNKKKLKNWFFWRNMPLNQRAYKKKSSKD